MSPEPHTEYCVSEEQLLWMRRRLLELRRNHPILIIDTYWTADGEAFCPAAMGLGYHIGPRGSLEICPALSFASDTVHGCPSTMAANVIAAAVKPTCNPPRPIRRAPAGISRPAGSVTGNRRTSLWRARPDNSVPV